MSQQITNNLMMVRPECFGYDKETAENNSFQNNYPLSTELIIKKAKDEFDNYVNQLRLNQIEVLVIADTLTPKKPDAVFPNNWFCTFPNGDLYLFPMFAPCRRRERRRPILQRLKQEFKINRITDWSTYEEEGLFLEGTGSIVFDHINKYAFAALSPRTSHPLFQKFCKEINYEPVAFNAVDEKNQSIYHTNVILHIATDYAVICTEAIKSENEKRYLKSFLTLEGKTVIELTFEQVRQFAGNMLQVSNTKKEKFTILSSQAYKSLSERQKAIITESSNLLPVNIPTIETIGGGSARCMIAEIFPDKR